MARTVRQPVPRVGGPTAAALADRELLAAFFALAAELTAAETVEELWSVVAEGARSITHADYATVTVSAGEAAGREF